MQIEELSYLKEFERRFSENYELMVNLKRLISTILTFQDQFTKQLMAQALKRKPISHENEPSKSHLHLSNFYQFLVLICDTISKSGSVAVLPLSEFHDLIQ